LLSPWTFDASQMPAFMHLNNGCHCQSCPHRKKDGPQLPKRTKGFSPGAAARASQAVRSAGSIAFPLLPRIGPAERRTGSRSLRFSGNPGKPLMRLILPALAAAGRCRLNSDRNDNARSLTRRVGVGGDLAAFPVFPTEVVAVPRTPTHYRWGSPANSDSYASCAIGFRTQQGRAALPGPSGRAAGQTGTVPAVRDGIQMNDA
jgi:hypothetical protein